MEDNTEILDGNTPLDIETNEVNVQFGFVLFCGLAVLFVIYRILYWIGLYLHRRATRKTTHQDTGISSPPPLTKLQDELDDDDDGEPAELPTAGQVFRKAMPVWHTPPSTSPGQRSRQYGTPDETPVPYTTPGTVRTFTRPRQSVKSPIHATKALTFTSPRSIKKRTPAAEGWDPALLAACQQNEAAISSLSGLQQSKEFQTHIRERHGNLDRYLEQVQSKIDIYRKLRSLDRTGFVNAMTRQKIQDFESMPPNMLFMLLETVVNAGISFMLYYTAMASGSWAGMYTWLAVQTVGAWWHAKPSILGRMLGLHCVVECEEYPEHTFSAPAWRVILAGISETALNCASLGVAPLLRLIYQAMTGVRCSYPQGCLGLRIEREICTGLINIPQFPSPPPKSSSSRLGLVSSPPVQSDEGHVQNRLPTFTLGQVSHTPTQKLSDAFGSVENSAQKPQPAPGSALASKFTFTGRKRGSRPAPQSPGFTGFGNATPLAGGGNTRLVNDDADIAAVTFNTLAEQAKTGGASAISSAGFGGRNAGIFEASLQDWNGAVAGGNTLQQATSVFDRSGHAASPPIPWRWPNGRRRSSIPSGSANGSLLFSMNNSESGGPSGNNH